MCHLHNGLSISADVDTLANDAITVRQAVLEEDERQRSSNEITDVQEISSQEASRNGYISTDQKEGTYGVSGAERDVSFSEGEASQCSSDLETNRHGKIRSLPSSTEAQRGVRERKPHSLMLPPGPIFDDIGNLAFGKDCNSVPRDLYSDKNVPRYMYFPEKLTEKDAMKLMGTEKGESNCDDGICDTLLRDGQKGSVKQRVK